MQGLFFALVSGMFLPVIYGGTIEPAESARSKRFLDLNIWDRSMYDKRLPPRPQSSAFWGGFRVPNRRRGSPEQLGEREGAVWENGQPAAVIVDSPHRTPWEEEDRGLLDFSFNSPTPWWRGPNVCIDKKEVENDPDVRGNFTSVFNFHSKQCSETDLAYICKTTIKTNNESKTVIEKYSCCHGFRRRQDGHSGCVEADFKDVLDTMKEIGASKFFEMVENTEIEGRLKMTNITVFSPTNVALKDFEHNNEVVNKIDTKMEEILAQHIVDGMYLTSDFTDEMVLPTIDKKSTIRINEFYNPYRIMTANCVPIVSQNNLAKNGIVHMVDETLSQPSKSIADIVTSDPQFSILKGLLGSAGLVQTLRDPEEHYTIFAPTDAAFSKIHPDVLEKWKNGESCMEKLIRGHILPHVICTSAVPSSARVRNILNEPLTVERDSDNKLFVEGVQVVARDILGTNGVVHIVDGILMTSESKTLMQSLLDRKLGDLVHLIESAKLTSELENMDNYTFFAPSQDALKEVSLREWEYIKSDGDRLASILRYHTVPQRLDPRNFFNNMLLPTSVPESFIRINVFSKVTFFEHPIVTAQCARVLSTSNPVCGGNVYIVDKVLSRPYPSVVQVLESRNDTTMFLKLLKQGKLEDQIKNNSGPFTLVVPNDAAFQKLPKKTLDRLEREEGETVVKQHVLPEIVCTTGISHSGFFFTQQFRTLEAGIIPAQRSLRGNIYFSNARVIISDIMAENGVVHIVDRVLNLESESHFNFGLDFPPFFRSF